jgi:uncharacterized protein (DUF1501 family)
MNSWSRRRFLVASGVAGVAAAGAGAVTWSQVFASSAATPKPIGQRTLVLVTLYGGNDGLNTLIPYADPAYQKARPQLAYDAADVLHLDGEFGLNPGMKNLAHLWSENRLAIVRGVGYPKPDHSHFRSMDIWQTASPAIPVNTGWIGRWLDATGDDPLRAVNIGTVLPPLAVGSHATAAALPLGRRRTADPGLEKAMLSLGAAVPGESSAQAMVRSAYRAENLVDASFAQVLAPGSGTDSGTDSDETSEAGSAGGQSGLAAQLALVARCITAAVPTRVYVVSLGGFDTHANEKAAQQSQLTQLDTAVGHFFDALASSPHGRDVVLVAYSEFGRRVAANASQGTDHGTAAPVFIAGAPVRGGFYGASPSLTDLDDGDLKYGADFRDVYAELLSGVLGSDPTQVLGAGRKPVSFLT